MERLELTVAAIKQTNWLPTLRSSQYFCPGNLMIHHGDKWYVALCRLHFEPSS